MSAQSLHSFTFTHSADQAVDSCVVSLSLWSCPWRQFIRARSVCQRTSLFVIMVDTGVSISVKSCTVSVAHSVSVNMMRELHCVQVSCKNTKERVRTSGAKTQCKQA